PAGTVLLKGTTDLAISGSGVINGNGLTSTTMQAANGTLSFVGATQTVTGPLSLIGTTVNVNAASTVVSDISNQSLTVTTSNLSNCGTLQATGSGTISVASPAGNGLVVTGGGTLTAGGSVSLPATQLTLSVQGVGQQINGTANLFANGGSGQVQVQSGATLTG